MGYRIATPRWKRETQSGFAREDGPRSAIGRDLSVDKVLLAVVLGLTLFGVVMVYSASAVLAQRNYGSQFYFLSRQGMWAVVGLIAMAVGMCIDYRHYKRPVVVKGLLVFTVLLLGAVFLFPAHRSTHRWIRYEGVLSILSIQPAEISKLALVAFLSFFLCERSGQLDKFKGTFLPAALVGGTLIGLVALEPDLGTALALVAIFTSMLFQAGVPLRYLASLGLLALPALVYMLLVPWRFQRIMDFLDPWENQTGSSFQIVQSLIAVGSGGSGGLGFAQGKQKLFYLPAPHTDFIFSVIAEELGLLGAATVVLMFALLAWRGFRAAKFAPDMFGQLFAVGLTTMIAVQALFNVSVTLSLVPAKGIPLPFISSGGTSLAISLFAAGLLLNVSKHLKK
jgi:cell division protein FtsW